MAFTIITSPPNKANLNNTAGSPPSQAQVAIDLGKAVDALEALDVEAVARRRVAQIVTYQTGAVATGSTALPIDDTIPQNTEGDQYMSLAITPKHASSTLVIRVTCYLSSNVSNANLVAALFQDSTANALAVGDSLQPTATAMTNVTLEHVMAAGTTSSTTFKVRCGNSTGTTTFNGASGSRFFGGVYASRITITEYLP